MMSALTVFAESERSNEAGPNGDFYAYVPFTPNAPATTYAFAEPKEGKVTVEFDVTPLSDSIEGHIAFNTVDPIMSFTNDRKINIMLRPNGQFAANDDAATTSENRINYSKGDTYQVAVTMDVENKTYSATVNGITLAENYKFRNRAPIDINNIGVMGVVALSGKFKVTNISEMLEGLVDNDTVGMDETNNPATVNGVSVHLVWSDTQV